MGKPSSQSPERLTKIYSKEKEQPKNPAREKINNESTTGKLKENEGHKESQAFKKEVQSTENVKRKRRIGSDKSTGTSRAATLYRTMPR